MNLSARIALRYLSLVVACMIVLGGCQKAPEEPLLSLDASAPWKIWRDGGKPELCPKADGWLKPVLQLNSDHRTFLLRLDLADVPGLDGRAPIEIVEFQATLDVPQGLLGGGSTPSGWAAYSIDQDWNWQEPHGNGWVNLKTIGHHETKLPPRFSKDATAVGVYISLNDQEDPQRAFNGPALIRIDKLSLRPSLLRTLPIPDKGPVEKALERESGWKCDPRYRGGTQVTKMDGLPSILCDLDSTDRTKLSAVARLDLPPLDMRERGLFITVDVPESLVSIEKFKSGIHVGVYSGKEVLWGAWQAIGYPGKITVALYPEIRFPLPMAFRSAAFDPSKVDGIAVRITMDQGAQMKFGGTVLIKQAEIVASPPAALEMQNAIAARLDQDFPPPVIRAVNPRKVPIEDFVRNSGVNYPWPLENGEGVYPVIGAKCYTSAKKIGGLEVHRSDIQNDFRFLAAHKVRLVRIWLLGDLRRNLKGDQGARVIVGGRALSDLRLLLNEAEAAGIDLIPVLLDFMVNDGYDRERLGVTGEYPEILTDAAVRKQFLDSLQPILDLLCASKAVRVIDLWNEPDQMRAPMDAIVATIADLASRVHRTRGAKPVTVGARSSIDLPFWMRAKIDVPSFHWFAKMEANSYPKAWAPPVIDRASTLVTEVESTGGVGATLSELWEAGFGGGLLWSMNAADGISPFGQQEALEFKNWVETHMPGR
jgi:hypothetical protein